MSDSRARAIEAIGKMLVAWRSENMEASYLQVGWLNNIYGVQQIAELAYDRAAHAEDEIVTPGVLDGEKR